MPTSQPIPSELERLASQWLHERRRQAGSDAWYEAQRLASVNPNAALCLTLAILEQVDLTPQATNTEDDSLTAHIASIPNYVLEHHAEAFVDRIEQEAGRNEVFRALLGRMSLADDAAPQSVLQRLSAASGGRLQVYPAPGSDLGRVAYDVADEYRSGNLPNVPRGTSFPVPLLAQEIARRLPGRTVQEYEIAAGKGLDWSR